MDLLSLRAALSGVSAYLTVTGAPALRDIRRLLDALARGDGEAALEAYAALSSTCCGQGGFAGLGDWLWDKLRYTETPYARLLDRGGADPALENAARRDVDTLVLLAGTDCDQLIGAMRPLLPRRVQPGAGRPAPVAGRRPL